jgi:hypothetical protein
MLIMFNKVISQLSVSRITNLQIKCDAYLPGVHLIPSKVLKFKLCMLCIFCDITKAFECVNHKILLSKLYHYGIRGVNALWFESYLLKIRQKIEITLQNKKENLSSNWGIIKSGVQQGSILGLFISNIY